MFLGIKKRLSALERGFSLLAVDREREKQVRYTTYQENGKKYLALFGVGADGIAWSKHFIVESIAMDRGINADRINNEALFQESKPL